MIPKTGDIVKLNHDFLKVWFNMYNKYFGEEVWKKIFIVTEVQDLEDKLIIYIECKVSKYIISILSNGEFNKTNEYKGIQVFIPPNVSKDNNIYYSYNDSIHEHCNKNRDLGNIKHNIISDIYCSCDGPTKENWAGGKKFYVCIVCKKEKLVKTLDVENEEKFINEWKRTLSKYN